MLLRAFAKINLDLRVLGPRDDGYHEVRTVLQTIDWHDEIRMESADQFEFSAQGAPPDETNLVVRAVREFERVTRAPARVRIALTKSIPIGAGLGGGSADAAVTMLGLQRLTCRNLSNLELFGCLRALGSDVPFFAIGGAAVGVGRGDEVFPLEDPPHGAGYYLVVVDPGVAIRTADAYSWLTVSDKSPRIEGFCAQFLPGSMSQDGTNDFEDIVLERYPALRSIRHELLRLGAFRASLSGSGSAVFGMFHRLEDAGRAAEELSDRFAARVTRLVPRAEYWNKVFGQEY